jgi:hypothetical protein
MEDLFDRVLDRTRSRLDIPALRTIFGLKNRPHQNRAGGPPAQEAVIEKSQYGLTWFKVAFGRLQLKAYTKGEHVLRFEATVHNTKELRCRRSLENFPEIITRLAGHDRAVRHHPRLRRHQFPARRHVRWAAAAVPARRHPHRRHRPEQAPDPRRPIRRTGPGRRTARLHRRRVHGQGPAGEQARDYTTRQGAYDLRKLRGKNFAVKPGRTRRYHIPPEAARTIAALLALRDQIIAPILAGVRSPAAAANPPTGPPSTATTRPFASACRTSSTTSGSPPQPPPHRQHFVDRRNASS